MNKIGTYKQKENTVYGFHSVFEILRVDGNEASIISLNNRPKDLKIGDLVFYGIDGSLYEVLDTFMYRDNIVKATVKIHK